MTRLHAASPSPLHVRFSHAGIRFTALGPQAVTDLLSSGHTTVAHGFYSAVASRRKVHMTTQIEKGGVQ
ncbi:hypothetical protein [Sinorhizobium meliloti]|jgi:hypothetical protein|uniref:hypothetical protein n=1 Tax=Rhizobium meliloti TaxID=382 RepID=UPI000FDA6F73|nr:hypothetical protein [Sinorhizobium meliloti]RVK27331.1 hypothetical protein CN163_30930 [Sinorhizobium meliloti]